MDGLGGATSYIDYVISGDTEAELRGIVDALTEEFKVEDVLLIRRTGAPYGKRAEEALRSSGLWDKVQSKLVFGENISQTTQYVQSGSAQVGIIALSLALNPELSKRGGYYLIHENLHNPLEQGYIITKRGADKPLAKTFADYMRSKPARIIMTKYGFVLPGEKTGK